MMPQMREDIQSDCQLRDRAEWMLCLLSVPDERGEIQPLEGRTRLVKAMFLLHRNLEEHFGEDAGYNFEAYKYGPFDKGVYEASETLEEKGFITITPGSGRADSQDDTKYQPTTRGENHAEALLNDISEEKVKLLKWVRFKQASKPLGSLLSYVYTKYPDMTTESEIADRVS